MPEPVRLVIWDLDETFWKGTLTEGGIEYQRTAHDIVIELAHRGIMSSICSKNDLEPVRKILTEQGLWDYFIFPSINWEPKGQRIAALIEAVQLRPATVMFVDDNPMNLNEALHYVPDLQVASEQIIPDILGSPLFVGKDDSALSRLKQYKLLERKKTDEESAGSDNSAFLRSSNIRVIIDHDIEAHIDRVVELINRTNQLNFTKLRLSEDPETARAELRDMISGFRIQAGVIRVVDNYGDYGFCGFYAINRAAGRDGDRANLVHFAFSCRILNMGVENWLYQHLGRPKLNVVGEVLTDVVGDTRSIDWIELQSPTSAAWGIGKGSAKPLKHVLLHGGCDLNAIMHYFSGTATTVKGEFQAARDGLVARTDHSMFLRYAVEGLSPEAAEATASMGYLPDVFASEIATIGGPAVISVLSFWTDASMPLYRHRRLGFRLPFTQVPVPKDYKLSRFTEVPVSALDPKWQSHWIAQALEYLHENFIYEGMITDEMFAENMEIILDAARHQEQVFILCGNERLDRKDRKKEGVYKGMARLNHIVRDVSRNFANISLIDIHDCIHSADEIHAQSHFDRMIYFRAFEMIMKSTIDFKAALAA